jgi:uncharacterized repeat protein (TIGR01451 family)
MSTGDLLNRTFSVLVNGDLISGTQIVNRDYRTLWISGTTVLSNTGTLVTSTVREIGLIDSFKTVSPLLVRPGPGNVLTYTLHVVNSSPSSLTGVHLYDIFPWEHGTYRRDAVATAGQIISDIVSLEWFGNVAPFDTELITFSVLVDADYQGAITNTATIDHPSLREPVPITAVAYVTQKPVLSISKTDSPDPVRAGDELLYTLRVQNLGQQATNVEVTDLIPVHTTYLSNSATAGGELEGDTLRWWFPLLAPGEVRTFSFLVHVLGGQQIVNDTYWISCAEGVLATGLPVYTDLEYNQFYLPFIRR